MGNHRKKLKIFPVNSFQAYVPFLSSLQLSDVFGGYIKSRRFNWNGLKNILITLFWKYIFALEFQVNKRKVMQRQKHAI